MSSNIKVEIICEWCGKKFMPKQQSHASARSVAPNTLIKSGCTKRIEEVKRLTATPCKVDM